MAFPTGWTRKCALVVQHGQVAANQTAYPVLITNASGCLPAEMVTLGGANAAQSDGGDIRFSSDLAGASQLACEIVLWVQNATPASAKAEIWVPVNVLSASDVTIYVWYKAGGGVAQPAANAAFGSQAVWDSNYKAVYHFGDGTTLSLNDSTSNANTGTNHGVTAAVGNVFGGAAFFVSASSQYIDVGNPSSLQITGPLTIEAVATFTGINGSIERLVSKLSNSPYNGYELIYGTSVFNEAYLQCGNASTLSTAKATSGSALIQFISCTYDGTTGQSYANGAVSGSAFTQASAIGATATNVNIGRWTGGASNYFGGASDELRISNIARSASWLAVQYANLNSPGAFIIAGTPGSGGGGGTVVSVTCSILITGAGSGSGTSTLTCSIGIGYGGLSTSCGAPPAATVGIGGFLYRPPVVMGSLNLSAIYDLNHTLTWEVSALPPGLRWDSDPSSSTYGHIVGTPTLAGTFFYAYTVSSPDGQRISNSCALIVNPGAPGTGPFSIVSCSITIAPADGSGPPCPPDAIGGPG